MKPIKKSWNDITVSDFQRIYELEKKGDEDKLLYLIAIVNGVDIEEVMNMPISELERHYDDIDFLAVEPKLLPIVDKILAAKKLNANANIGKEEREIDNIVFDLYGLTPEEREVIGYIDIK